MSEVTGGRPDTTPQYAATADLDALRRDWEAVGGYLHTAMLEVAQDLGGEELAERIAGLAVSDGVLPNPDALKALEDIQEGAAERVVVRSGEIQQETHQRELAELRKPSLRKYGRAVLQGFASFNLFGSTPRRRV